MDLGLGFIPDGVGDGDGEGMWLLRKLDRLAYGLMER